jgi:predicted S18 family serine protease
MQKVMKESVAAAAQFIKINAQHVGLPNDWQDNYDIAVLATMMGVPKEGPSAGITIVTGIVSALTGRPVRNDLAMTGEITIMGKVLAIGGVLPKLQAAVEAGCTEVLMPKENERDVQMTPDYVKNKIIDDFTDDDLSPEDHLWLDGLTRESAFDFAAQQGYDLKDYIHGGLCLRLVGLYLDDPSRDEASANAGEAGCRSV